MAQINQVALVFDGSLPQEGWPTYVHGLRSEPFAFEGKVFGRMLLT